MNAFKLSLLFLALIAVMNIQQPKQKLELRSIILQDAGKIPFTGQLIIPTLLKWDAPVVYSRVAGVIELRIKQMKFVYVRSLDVPRNEYRLTKAYISEIGVKKGDEIEIDFSHSNMQNGESIPAMLKVGDE